MKLSFLSPILICSLAPFSWVYAQDNQGLPEVPEVISTRTKITCSSDIQENIKFTDGTSQTYSFKGKGSESIRTSWKVGSKEYRISEYKSFDEAGNVTSMGYVIAEYELSEANGLRTEKSSGTRVTQYLGNRYTMVEGKRSRILKATSTSEDVFVVDGSKITLVKSTYNGKPADVGIVTYETQDSPTQKTQRTVGLTGTRLNDDGSISDVIKDEVVCVLETL